MCEDKTRFRGFEVDQILEYVLHDQAYSSFKFGSLFKALGSCFVLLRLFFISNCLIFHLRLSIEFQLNEN